MRYAMKGRLTWILMVALFVTANGCRPAESEPAAELAVATLEPGRETQETIQLEGTIEEPTPTDAARKTPRPTPEDTAAQPQASPSSQPDQVENSEDRGPEYQVVFVETDDVLNVRSGPGVENSIVGALVPGTGGLRATGTAVQAAGSPWLPITDEAVSGWANRRFLTEQMESAAFCQTGEITQLIGALRAAAAERDGPALAELVDPQGGLRLNRHWWNPTIYIAQEEISQLFESSALYHWGVADGTGDSIDGSFREIILPLWDRNLLPASEFGCDEILHGGTAGLTNLPAPYEGIHFISLHRVPGVDGFELDWGTWVVGIERRQGHYYVSYLVHYEWEI
jgi:hypothetical protein